ncbi:MAG: NAD(+)/NADH kinase [Chloroflexaceae bacterium]|nr:NAD(+)/NADH kinase [Chloroflexaceae bacterium]
MKQIGIIYHPYSQASIRQAEEMMPWLQSQGVEVWRSSSDDARSNTDVLARTNLLIALGGDGTALRAAIVAIPYQIPVLPVAMGRLNFLSEMTPAELTDGLQTLIHGGGWYDQRTLIRVVLHRHNQVIREFTGINEVVISRGDVSRIVTVEVSIDAMPLITYRADGVLVSTATGSTAYALSAGGPIMDPRSHALLLVPVAAHLTPVHSMVLHEDSLVTLVLATSYHATLSIDGQEHIPLVEQDIVTVQRSEQMCLFARVQSPTQFYGSLVRRLRWDA